MKIVNTSPKHKPITRNDIRMMEVVVSNWGLRPQVAFMSEVEFTVLLNLCREGDFLFTAWLDERAAEEG